MLDSAAYAAFWEVTSATGIKPEWLIAVLNAESGLRPDIVNSIGCAGLNQLCHDWLTKLGFTAQSYAALPASEQLRQGVLPYMADAVHRYGPIRSGTRLYQANYLPATMSAATAAAAGVGYAKSLGDTLTSSPSPYYTQNKGFDTAGKGYITLQDLANAVARSAVQPQVQQAIRDTYAARDTASASASTSPTDINEIVYGDDFSFLQQNVWLKNALVVAGIAAVGGGVIYAIETHKLDRFILPKRNRRRR
jgi:hypothetical protein